MAKSLGLGLISFDAGDLEGLGSEFHAQDRRRSLRKTEEQVAENASTGEIKKSTAATTTSASEGAAAEDSPAKSTTKENQETSDESAISKAPIEDEWKVDWADFATFSNRFFAARSRKWEDDDGISYSAWRDRANESYARILDSISVKAGQKIQAPL